MRMTRTSRLLGTALAAALGLSLTGCGMGGGETTDTGTTSSTDAAGTASPGTPDPGATDPGTSPGTTDPGATAPAPGTTSNPAAPGTTAPGKGSGDVVVLTHDSFTVPDEVLAKFTEQTGYTVKIQQQGDAGELTNKLVLTKDAPLGDVVFGIDNSFASRAVTEGVLTAHTATLPTGADAYNLPGEAAAQLAPIDYGDVCINIDDAWFATKKVNPPKTLDDLTKPDYKGLLVVPSAATSSPGLSFLLATIADQGEDGWKAYWEKLVANEVKIASGWTDAYTVDFTAGGGKGDRPIVLSYASSPPFTIPKGGDKPTTSALLDTCFRQIEYAGVLNGAKNPEGAQAFLAFMLGEEFQTAIPDNMYMYPVSADVALPELWAAWAKVADKPLTVDPARIEEQRTTWIDEWTTLVSG